jgi:carboxymethylenebutenolidase
MFHCIPDITDGAKKRDNLSDVEIANDIHATVDYVQGRSDVDGSRIGIIGHCMGGRMSFQGAIESAAIKACAVFYGGNMMKTWGRDIPKTPFERLDETTCPVIGFFGLDDENPSPADVDQIEHALKDLKIDCEFHRYEEAGHAFQNILNRDKFRKDPNVDAWTRTLDFLSDKLG